MVLKNITFLCLIEKYYFIRALKAAGGGWKWIIKIIWIIKQNHQRYYHAHIKIIWMHAMIFYQIDGGKQQNEVDFS